MKKFLTLAALSLSSLAFVSNAEAKTTPAANTTTVAANSAVASQFQRRVVTTTRTVRRGRFLYRETYRTTYRRNGVVNRRLINRVVIRRY